MQGESELTCPLESEAHMSNCGARCQLLGNSGVTRLLVRQRQGLIVLGGIAPGLRRLTLKASNGSHKIPHSQTCPHPDALSESGHRLGDARARRSSEN